MIPAEPTSWLGAVPVVLVTLLVLLVPGGLAARLLGVRGFLSLAVAPALSVTTVGLGAVLASAVGVRWGVVPFLASVFLACALALGVRLLLLRLPWARGPQQDGPPPRPVRATGWPVGLVVAATLVTVVYVRVTRTASAFSQQPDTVFHLGVIRWMLERGDASSLHALGFSSATGTGFYPAAFHDLAVTVCLITGTSGVVSGSVVALVAGAVVWPLGALALGYLVVGPGRATSLAVGVTAAAATTFPYWFFGYGVLWPSLLGYALMPAALAVTVSALRPARSGVPRLVSVAALLAMLPGVGLAHPNALIGLGPFVLLAVVERVVEVVVRDVRSGRRRRAVVVVTSSLAVLAVGAAGWAVATSRATAMRASNPLGGEMPLRDGVVEAVTFASRGGPRLWLLGVLLVAGAVVLLQRNGSRWLVGSVVVACSLYVLVVAVDTVQTRWFTWPWYNNTPRFAALVVVPGAVVAAAGLAAPAQWWAGRRRRAARERGGPWWAAAVVPAVFLLVTGGGYVRAHLDFDERYFAPSYDRTWASPDELAALRTLSRYISPDDVTAANPWNGGTYLYLVTGRRLLFPTEKSLAPGDREALAARLDEVTTSPHVCQAAQRQRVRFVITGGRPWSKETVGSWRDYEGVDAVSRERGFLPVQAAGPYTLWSVPRCTP